MTSFYNAAVLRTQRDNSPRGGKRTVVDALASQLLYVEMLGRWAALVLPCTATPSLKRKQKESRMARCLALQAKTANIDVWISFASCRLDNLVDKVTNHLRRWENPADERESHHHDRSPVSQYEISDWQTISTYHFYDSCGPCSSLVADNPTKSDLARSERLCRSSKLKHIPVYRMSFQNMKNLSESLRNDIRPKN